MNSPNIENTMSSFRRISPKEAADLIAKEGYVYVDVRSPGEYESGHPAASYNVPVAMPGPGGMQPNPDFLAVMQANFPKDSKLVIGCQSGNRSQRAIGMLQQAGYANLVDQRAGWGGSRDPFGRVAEAGWPGEGLPSESGPSAERGYTALRGKVK
jgi:rhodanese-related sulfurtransferase